MAGAGKLAKNPFSAAAIDGFIELNRGLNSGHISFASDDTAVIRKGQVTFERVAAEIVSQ
ncbi:hypothetical protein [Burkholderia sp. IMCC1007]|uniref:hypothetical protein n=1 Tax=Burkholderia sp. IMCC1007 TaxID=3004104 RepID=UPI0022B43FBD|nr:hypothetical protein [Burkholderia sp. IMCC1007]